jgi:PAS domain S-box-containing protein
MPLGPDATRVVTTFADITAHLETLRGLRASEERYRGLVESLPLALVQFDPTGRVTYMNPAAEALTGHRLAEAAESNGLSADFFSIDTKQPSQEVRFRTRGGGEERVAYVLLQSGTESGAAGPGLTALLVDVTRERRLEQELQRAQRLELVGRLAGGIARLQQPAHGHPDAGRADARQAPHRPRGPERHRVQIEAGRMRRCPRNCWRSASSGGRLHGV